MGDFDCCVSVFRPDDRVATPISDLMAINYFETVLRGSDTWAKAGVERSDEEREGAFLED